MSKKIKKYVLPYFPYLIAFWFFSKCGTAYRMAAGANLGEKLFGMVKTIGPVFQSYVPGLGLFDLAVQNQKRPEISPGYGIWLGPLGYRGRYKAIC